jgi:glycosyltransferase involved in cell wall biosynthesis
MRIVIDMQGAQSEHRDRGIGRYTTALAKAILRNCREHEIFLVLNAGFEDTLERMRHDFEPLVNRAQIKIWRGPMPVSASSSDNAWKRKASELTREAFLASLEPDVVIVSSLFEGWGYNAVTSIGLAGAAFPTAVVLYDLIPHRYRDVYLSNPFQEQWYESKLGHLRRADLWLAISESSRAECIELGLPERMSVNISAAADEHFRPMAFSDAAEQALRERHGLRRPFLMYTGGADHRKNLDRLIRAYALLPKALRSRHQLAIICSIDAGTRAALASLAAKLGMTADELVLTGFVTDDDLVALYNLCYAFVFPSWHEGFGLPALEAMRCGAAVIGANTSSVPEVIGLDAALFDPFDERAIAEKMQRVLADPAFHEELRQHSLRQARAFSWDKTARSAIQACERLHSEAAAVPRRVDKSGSRPRLAYFSPLPPQRSGIADYSAELLPELARHYDIDVVVTQSEVTSAAVTGNFPVRTVAWFEAHSQQFDRVLYHLGNSEFHMHMFDLVHRYPGTVVLHDFFLGNVAAHMEGTGYRSGGWANELYLAGGYPAVAERFQTLPADDGVVWKYPCNLGPLNAAVGVIVHSEHSRQLAQTWYGEHSARNWSVIPLLRIASLPPDKAAAREALGLSEDALVVCSFGLMGPTKLNDRLLSAWMNSSLATDQRCVLVFCGANEEGAYGAKLTRRIHDAALDGRVRITGWLDAPDFKQWLVAADIAVQLRTLSRGETSAAVLDCMNHGIATIVNANGAMSELPRTAVSMLPDEFEESALVAALEDLCRCKTERERLGESARRWIRERHHPRRCAELYAQAIERSYAKAAPSPRLISALKALPDAPVNRLDWNELATALADSFPVARAARQLLVDVSWLALSDSRTGIQRVVRGVLKELLANPPPGMRVEPVYLDQEQTFRYARRFTAKLVGCPPDAFVDDSVEATAGDIFLGLDLNHRVAGQRAYFSRLRALGVDVRFVVYDLLPVLMPHEYFSAEVSQLHAQWLAAVNESDGAICISRAVADEFAQWLDVFAPARARPFRIDWFHLGADLAESLPSHGLPPEAQDVLQGLRKNPTFLMVGTVEPRKGHAQALAAFELLWKRGRDVSLVVVGKPGWNTDRLMGNLRAHPELGKRLHWMESTSDEYLEKVYAAARCLLVASEGEGFGLPLVEAAHRGLPVLARDLPVFRETGGGGASYFSGTDPEALALAVGEWLELYERGALPDSSTITTLSWAQSTAQLVKSLTGAPPYREWISDGVRRYWGSDHRLHTQVGRKAGQTIATTGAAGYLLYGPYVPITPGTYQILVFVNAANKLSSARLEVTAAKGAKNLGQHHLHAPGRDGCAGDLRFSVSEYQEDVEIRVWVDGVDCLTISRIEMRSCQDGVQPDVATARSERTFSDGKRTEAGAHP